jgi:hypothetical protein
MEYVDWLFLDPIKMLHYFDWVLMQYVDWLFLDPIKMLHYFDWVLQCYTGLLMQYVDWLFLDPIKILHCIFKQFILTIYMLRTTLRTTCTHSKCCVLHVLIERPYYRFAPSK